MIEFEVSGLPKPQGSKTAMVIPPKNLVSSLHAIAGSKDPRKAFYAATSTIVKEVAGDALKEWREEVEDAAKEVMKGKTIYAEPVAVTLVFFLRRPKKDYRTGLHAGVIKDSAPTFHDKTPDIDKLTRAVFDAMTEVVYGDDSMVVRMQCVKDFAKVRHETGCRVLVEPIRCRSQLYANISESEGIAPKQINLPF